MVGRKLHRAQMLSSRTEELLDDVTNDLDDLRDMIRRSIPSSPHSNQKPGSPVAPRKTKQFAGESFHGSVSVTLAPRPDGSTMAQIDGRPGIPLPPLVAALLEILKADDGIASDPMVGWKSIAAIQFALKERTKQNHSESAVKELVYRLRGLLERHGENPFLIQTNRLLGYRFALQRGAGPLTERDNH